MSCPECKMYAHPTNHKTEFKKLSVVNINLFTKLCLPTGCISMKIQTRLLHLVNGFCITNKVYIMNLDE